MSYWPTNEEPEKRLQGLSLGRGRDESEERVIERDYFVPAKNWAHLCSWLALMALVVAGSAAPYPIVIWPLTALFLAQTIRHVLAINRDWRYWKSEWRAMGLLLD